MQLNSTYEWIDVFCGVKHVYGNMDDDIVSRHRCDSNTN